MAEVQARLDDWLQVEFTHYALQAEAARIAALSPEDQAFVLGWIRRSAAVNVQLGHYVATHAPAMLTPATRRPLEAWVLQALDEFDRSGLKAALEAARHPERFVAPGREHAGAAVYADFAGVRPLCISVDKEARDYLPQLYGAAQFTVVDDVARLPYKVAETYRRLTR